MIQVAMLDTRRALLLFRLAVDLHHLAGECPHGQVFDEPLLGGWACPLGECRCCRQWYPYMNSSVMAFSGRGRSTEWPNDLCGHCGAVPTTRSWRRSAS